MFKALAHLPPLTQKQKKDLKALLSVEEFRLDGTELTKGYEESTHLLRKGIRTTSPQVKKLLGDLEVFIDAKIDALQFNLLTPETDGQLEENDDEEEEEKGDEKGDEEDDKPDSFIDDSEQPDDPDYTVSGK